MLAVILENRAQQKLLSGEKSHLEEMVKARTVELIESNESSRFTAFLQEFGKTVDDATAGDKCDVHSMAGAWFWFTVMTTVGKFEARSSLSPEEA